MCQITLRQDFEVLCQITLRLDLRARDGDGVKQASIIEGQDVDLEDVVAVVECRHELA